MRKYRTSLAVGFFLGVMAITSQQMLILFAIFVGRADDAENDSERSADRAFAAFCFILFVVYTLFTLLLATFRQDIISESDTSKFGDDLPEAARSTGV